MYGQGTQCHRNIAEKLNHLSREHERYRQQMTDRQVIAYSTFANKPLACCTFKSWLIMSQQLHKISFRWSSSQIFPAIHQSLYGFPNGADDSIQARVVHRTGVWVNEICYIYFQKDNHKLRSASQDSTSSCQMTYYKIQAKIVLRSILACGVGSNQKLRSNIILQSVLQRTGESSSTESDTPLPHAAPACSFGEPSQCKQPSVQHAALSDIVHG